MASVAGVIVFAALVSGAVALLKARTSLVPGSLAVVAGVPRLFLVPQQNTYSFVPAIPLAGVLTELSVGSCRRPRRRCSPLLP